MTDPAPGPFPDPGLGPADLAERLRAGQPALFPTDTVPALAACPDAVAQIWSLKERPREKPLILMAADADALFAALEVPAVPDWRRIARRHWPGALTLVLPARGEILEALNPGGRTLGVRIPAHDGARDLLRLSGPLATTSANRSGMPPLLTPAAAAAGFPGVPLLGPFPWCPGSGLPSTVVAWRTDRGPAGGWQVLRQGAVRLAEPAAGEPG